MKHPHAAVLEKFYADFAQGRYAEAAALGADAFSFQVPGKSRLAGKYAKATFAEFGTKLSEFSAGSFRFEAHDILVSDLHATVLASEKLVRDGKTIEMRAVHVWRFENGKPLAGYEYPRDLYAFDAAWA